MNKKIVLWYDNLNSNNCIFKNFVFKHSHVCQKLIKYNIPFCTKDTTQDFDKDDINCYLIELENVHINFDFLSLSKLETQKLFKKGMKIVFYYAKEGHSLEEWFLNIRKILVNHNISSNQVYFVFGDHDFEKNYKTFLKKHNIPTFLNPISIDFFLSDYYERANIFNNKIIGNKEFDFLFYNGKLRPHRLLSVSEMHDRNLINRGLVSFIDSTHSKRSFDFRQCIKILETVNYCPSHIYKFTENFKPLILDLTGDELFQDNINNTVLEHYNKSYFSIISETNVTTRFQTEKTFKPIANLHPFVMIGCARMLSLLKEKGFETFPELFDESYDNEENSVKRLTMVIDEVEKFTNLTIKEKNKKIDSIKNKLFFNKNHYISLAKVSGKKEFEKIFQIIGQKNEG